MIIEYDLNNQYLKCYNEAQGIMVNKNRVLRQKSNTVNSYLTQGFIYLIITIIFILLITILNKTNIIKDIIFLLKISVSFLIILLIIYFLLFIFSYNKVKNNNHKGYLIIDEKGITDNPTSGKIITVPHDKIKAVTTTKNTTTIITDGKYFFFVNKELYKDIIKEIKKYNNDLLIINERMK